MIAVRHLGQRGRKADGLFALHHPLPSSLNALQSCSCAPFLPRAPWRFPRANAPRPVCVSSYLSPETHRSRCLLDSVSSPFIRFLSWENSSIDSELVPVLKDFSFNPAEFYLMASVSS